MPLFRFAITLVGTMMDAPNSWGSWKEEEGIGE